MSTKKVKPKNHRMKTTVNKKGFTLIEVVLVLAIGGLIFLLAFLAFQQVSRNRRDTQRRGDASRILAEVQNYAGDNSNTLPASSVAVTGNPCTAGAGTAGTFLLFLQTYVCPITPPSGANYIVVVSTTAPTAVNQMRFTNGATCAGTSAGNVKVEIKLEAGLVCRDDS